MLDPKFTEQILAVWEADESHPHHSRTKRILPPRNAIRQWEQVRKIQEQNIVHRHNFFTGLSDRKYILEMSVVDGIFLDDPRKIDEQPFYLAAIGKRRELKTRIGEIVF